ARCDPSAAPLISRSLLLRYQDSYPIAPAASRELFIATPFFVIITSYAFIDRTDPVPDSTPLPFALDRQICFTLYRTNIAINRTYKPMLDEMGLTYPQYLVLN